MSRDQKKYISFSSVFVGRDKELSSILFSSTNIESHKDLKANTSKVFRSFTDLHNIEAQREFLQRNPHAVFDAIQDIIDKAHYDQELIKYTVPLLDGIISDDRKNGQYIIKNIKTNGDKTYITALQRLLGTSKHSILVHEAAAKVLSWILSELDVREYGDKQRDFLKLLLSLKDTKQQTQEIKVGDFNFLASLVYLLRVEKLVEVFLKAGGATILAQFLEQNSGDLQISYYALLNVWLISFTEVSKEYFADANIGLIRLIADVISKLSREKLVRVAFSTFRNLCDLSQDAIELMVDAQIIKFIEIQMKGNIKDEDVLEDLKYVGEVLEANLKILSSFEKYQKELHCQRLEWSPVHSEKFWRENIKKFEDEDYRLITQLVSLLDSSRAKNQAIACYDLGEFCRLHPFGRMVLEGQKGKSKIMDLAKQEDQSVRENALLALQKIMLHNWNIQVGK